MFKSNQYQSTSNLVMTPTFGPGHSKSKKMASQPTLMAWKAKILIGMEKADEAQKRRCAVLGSRTNLRNCQGFFRRAARKTARCQEESKQNKS